MLEQNQNIEQTTNTSVNNITDNVNNVQNNDKSLEQSLANLQDKWTEEIRMLNEKLKNLNTLDELLTYVYSKRQDAVDLYYGTYKVLAAQTRDYKVKAATLYNNIKAGKNGLRYSNENSISLQIEANLYNEKANLDLLTNFTNFMKDTIQTIDNIIYGINSKIKIYEMINGLKF